jgi:nucleoid DNA-binding protein
VCEIMPKDVSDLIELCLRDPESYHLRCGNTEGGYRTLHEVWEAMCVFIASSLAAGKGVNIPQFGYFSLKSGKPYFVLNHNVSQRFNISAKHISSGGPGSDYEKHNLIFLNFATIGSLSGHEALLNADVLENIFACALGQCVGGHSIVLDFKFATILVRERQMTVTFRSSFLQQLYERKEKDQVQGSQSLHGLTLGPRPEAPSVLSDYWRVHTCSRAEVFNTMEHVQLEGLKYIYY